jgi:hypothetical protein
MTSAWISYCTCLCLGGALTCWWTGQGLGNTAKVDNDSLDTVTLALYLGHQTLHLVPVERVGDILYFDQTTGLESSAAKQSTYPADIKGSHDCGCATLDLERYLRSRNEREEPLEI